MFATALQTRRRQPPSTEILSLPEAPAQGLLFASTTFTCFAYAKANQPLTMECATWILVIFTAVLAVSTVALAVATFGLALETKKASLRQLGVQNWLALEPRFDSKEMKRARKNLANRLNPYDLSRHDQITEEVLEFFESLGTLYNLELINEKLAVSSFSYYANYWWKAAKGYVDHERQIRGNDPSLFDEFEKFATAMRKHDPDIDDQKLKDFLENEARLKID